MKNKTQKAAEELAGKATHQPAEVPPEQPKAQPKLEPKPVTASVATAALDKQAQTIEKLKEGWTAKGVDLSRLTIRDDGKFKLLIVDAGWPTIRLGSTGGITVVELR